MDWFTSDNHFHHARVIEYCARPFASVWKMNEAMVRRWNARVQPQDTVYHLGDFALGPRPSVMGIRARLNGKIVLVRGNHDKSAAVMRECGFDDVVEDCELTDPRFGRIYLRHAPGPRHEAGPLPRNFDWFLHGHVHERWARKGKLVNVGVDVRDFEPKRLAELLGEPGQLPSYQGSQVGPGGGQLVGGAMAIEEIMLAM